MFYCAIVVQQFVFITHFKIRWSAIHQVRFAHRICSSHGWVGWFPCLMADRCGGAAIQPADCAARMTSAGAESGRLIVSFVPHLSVISCVDLCWISRSGPAWPHGNQTMTGMTRWRGWSQQPQTRCHLFFAYHSQHHVNMWLVCRWGGKDIDSHPLCRVWSKLLFVILLCTVLISLLYFFILHWFWNWVWLKSTKQMKWNLLCAAAVLWDQLE